MNRLPDWRNRLGLYLSEVARSQFRPGRHDCALFVAGGVNAMTGIDLARRWRGYSSLEGGQAMLEKAGFEDHIALVASLLPEVTPIFASVGDVAVVDGDTEGALGLVQGSKIYVLRRTGIGIVPLASASRAFAV